MAAMPWMTAMGNKEAVTKGKDIIIWSGKQFNLCTAIQPLRSLATEVLKQNGIGRLEGSRGCSYSLCEFCGTVEKYNGPGWRPLPIDFIVNELSALSQMGFKSPYFTDEDFVGDDPARIYRLADAIEQAKLDERINKNLDFYVNMRANSVLGIGIGGRDEAIHLLGRLKSVGLREVFIGVESGCKEQLNKRYKKGTTRQHNIDAIRTLYDLGFEVDLGFIFFDRDSTLAECRENLNFIYTACIEKHDSQLVKRVRIEPLTPLGCKYQKTYPKTVVDLNLVEYPYTFRHSEIAKIYKAFEYWQSEDLDVIYNLQSMCRGEVPTIFSRANIKNIIGAYRHLDIKYIKRLVDIFENGRPNKDSQVEIATAKFRERRKRLDKTHINRVKWLDSNFRRFGI